MLQTTAQLLFSAKFFAPPPKKPSTREREYLRTSEINAMIPPNMGQANLKGGINHLSYRTA